MADIDKPNIKMLKHDLKSDLTKEKPTLNTVRVNKDIRILIFAMVADDIIKNTTKLIVIFLTPTPKAKLNYLYIMCEQFSISELLFLL